MSTVEHLMGMDEAGRGSLIGPLIMVGVILKGENASQLQQLGVKDSKLYTGPKKVERRQKLALEIKKIAEHVKIIEISAKEITRSPNNLTTLQIEKAARAWMEFRPQKAFFDAIGPLNYFCRAFMNVLDGLTTTSTPLFSLRETVIDQEEAYMLIKDERDDMMKAIKVLNKGDQKELIIAAASIIAKDYRDQRIRELEREWNLEPWSLGSGYPNVKDQRLLRFLKEHQDDIRNRVYPFIRYNWNWQPLQDLLKKQTSLKDFF